MFRLINRDIERPVMSNAARTKKGLTTPSAKTIEKIITALTKQKGQQKQGLVKSTGLSAYCLGNALPYLLKNKTITSVKLKNAGPNESFLYYLSGDEVHHVNEKQVSCDDIYILIVKCKRVNKKEIMRKLGINRYEVDHGIERLLKDNRINQIFVRKRGPHTSYTYEPSAQAAERGKAEAFSTSELKTLLSYHGKGKSYQQVAIEMNMDAQRIKNKAFHMGLSLKGAA